MKKQVRCLQCSVISLSMSAVTESEGFNMLSSLLDGTARGKYCIMNNHIEACSIDISCQVGTVPSRKNKYATDIYLEAALSSDL